MTIFSYYLQSHKATIYWGERAPDNDYLARQNARYEQTPSKCVWFHAEKVGNDKVSSAHIYCYMEQPPQDVGGINGDLVKICALLTKYNCNAGRNAQELKVMYTPAYQVSKPQGSSKEGEVVVNNAARKLRINITKEPGQEIKSQVEYMEQQKIQSSSLEEVLKMHNKNVSASARQKPSQQKSAGIKNVEQMVLELENMDFKVRFDFSTAIKVQHRAKPTVERGNPKIYKKATCIDKETMDLLGDFDDEEIKRQSAPDKATTDLFGQFDDEEIEQQSVLDASCKIVPKQPAAPQKQPKASDARQVVAGPVTRQQVDTSDGKSTQEQEKPQSVVAQDEELQGSTGTSDEEPAQRQAQSPTSHAAQTFPKKKNGAKRKNKGTPAQPNPAERQGEEKAYRKGSQEDEASTNGAKAQ